MAPVITGKAKPARILIVSPVFAPTADSEAFCGGKVVLGLLKRNCQVAVLTLSHDAGYFSPRDESEYWTILKSCSHELQASPKTTRAFAVGCALKYKTVVYARWISSVIEKAKLLQNAIGFDIVYSRSLPVVAHIAGYWLSRCLKIPWIANLNDPWDWHLFPHLKRKREWLCESFSNYWLRRTILNADLLTYPSDRLWKFHETVS